MILIKNMVFVRHLKGYPESTELAVFARWYQGCQTFIALPIENGNLNEYTAVKHGFEFATFHSLFAFVAAYRESFVNDLVTDFSGLDTISKQLQDSGFIMSNDDGTKNRIVIRETGEPKIVQLRSFKIKAQSEYVVGISKGHLEQEPTLIPMNVKDRITILNSEFATNFIASGLMAINIDTPWSRSLRQLFTQPIIETQQLVDGDWVATGSYQFLSIDHHLTFDKDLTESVVVKAE